MNEDDWNFDSIPVRKFEVNWQFMSGKTRKAIVIFAAQRDEAVNKSFEKLGKNRDAWALLGVVELT